MCLARDTHQTDKKRKRKKNEIQTPSRRNHRLAGVKLPFRKTPPSNTPPPQGLATKEPSKRASASKETEQNSRKNQGHGSCGKRKKGHRTGHARTCKKRRKEVVQALSPCHTHRVTPKRTPDDFPLQSTCSPPGPSGVCAQQPLTYQHDTLFPPQNQQQKRKSI